LADVVATLLTVNRMFKRDHQNTMSSIIAEKKKT